MNNLHVAGDKYLMPLGTEVLQKCLSALKALLLIHTLGGAAKAGRRYIVNKGCVKTRGSEWDLMFLGETVLISRRE